MIPHQTSAGPKCPSSLKISPIPRPPFLISNNTRKWKSSYHFSSASVCYCKSKLGFKWNQAINLESSNQLALLEAIKGSQWPPSSINQQIEDSKNRHGYHFVLRTTVNRDQELLKRKIQWSSTIWPIKNLGCTQFQQATSEWLLSTTSPSTLGRSKPGRDLRLEARKGWEQGCLFSG